MHHHRGLLSRLCPPQGYLLWPTPRKSPDEGPYRISQGTFYKVSLSLMILTGGTTGTCNNELIVNDN